ncbi:MAG TPA: ATP-binding protein [Thermoanaerobaculia bacterium]|nr:ATP-binding protein [Thermoanaerobaculia bacterium]
MVDAESTCAQCNGSGWIARPGSLDAEPCSCQKEMKRKQRVSAARVPKRYLHCSLAGFHERNDYSLAAAKRRVAEFVDCWPAEDRGLLLMGGCGTGKTHLAVAALLEIIAQEKPGKLMFRNFQELVQDLQSSFDSNDVPKKGEILQPLLQADLLVLDELGSQKPTAFVQDTLYYIINSRYNDVRATIFTSNYLDEPREAKDEKLEERIGSRLRSRLWEMTTPVVITARDDYRQTVAGRGI